MALSKNKIREHKVHTRAINEAPVNAGSTIYVGGFICREAATGVIIPGADVAGLVPLGVAVEPMFPDDPDKALSAAYNNATGADGTVTGSGSERAVRYDQVGEYAFAVDSGTPKVGDPAYLIDDDTVDTAVNTSGIVAGVFTRPAPGGGWFVDIAKMRVGSLEAVVPQADIADLTGTPGTADGALVALPTLTDTPATADALRDDLTTNWAPAIDNNVADLQADLIAIKDALRAAGILV